VLVLADRRAGRWADFGTRAVSSLVLAPMALLCVWAGGVAFVALIAAVTLGLAVEWLRLLAAKPGHGAGAGRARVPAAGGKGWVAAGLAYFLLAGLSLIWLRSDEAAGLANTLLLLLLVWATDIGAYLVGRCIGGPRLAPRISPGKTWSGAAGGLIAAIAAGAVVAHITSDAGAWRAGVVAAGLGVVAQAGDLLESYVKRRLEVKDSGHLIPGHGGLFDRLDGLLAAAPVAALLALTLGRGVVLWQ